MKKTYIIPQMSVLAISPTLPLAGSKDITSNNGIGYGGVDENGSIDPSVKENTFDFEWE